MGLLTCAGQQIKTYRRNWLDKANAMADLNAGERDETEDLMSKYDSEPSSAAADELAALKAKMGLS